jgi:hypothetical protein
MNIHIRTSDQIKIAAIEDVKGSFAAAADSMLAAGEIELATFANASFDLAVNADSVDEADRAEFVSAYVAEALAHQRSQAEDYINDALADA